MDLTTQFFGKFSKGGFLPSKGSDINLISLYFAIFSIKNVEPVLGKHTIRTFIYIKVLFVLSINSYRL